MIVPDIIFNLQLAGWGKWRHIMRLCVSCRCISQWQTNEKSLLKIVHKADNYFWSICKYLIYHSCEYIEKDACHLLSMYILTLTYAKFALNNLNKWNDHSCHTLIKSFIGKTNLGQTLSPINISFNYTGPSKKNATEFWCIFWPRFPIVNMHLTYLVKQ